MVERVVGGKALPTEVHQQVVARTDGVPLFVEELTRMVLESGLLREQEDHYELTGPLPPWPSLPPCTTHSWPDSIDWPRSKRSRNWVPRWGERFPTSCSRL